MAAKHAQDKNPQSATSAKTKPQSSQTWSRRAIVWIASVVGTLIIALATTFGSGVGQRLFSDAFGPHSSGRVKVGSNESVQVQSAAYLSGFNEVFDFPTVLSEEQELAATRGISRGDYAQNMNAVVAMGGAPAFLQDVQIVLHGNGKQVVTITGLRVVKTCGAPLRGTELYNPAQSAIDDDSLGFDLDNAIPTAQFVNSDNHFYGNYFAKQVIQLKPDESDTISAFILTTRESCKFTFRMSVDYGSGAHVVSIDNNGRPFTITAGLSFDQFKEVYAGGDADPHPGGPYVRVNPDDFQG